MDPAWGDKVYPLGVRWKKFVENDGAQVADIRREIAALAMESGVPIDDYRRIVHTVQKGEREARQAKTEMVEANLRLVISIAKKYTNRGLQAAAASCAASWIAEHRLLAVPRGLG